MSIRLRLTLLYSAILALTLLAFSTVLYLTVSRSTLNVITGTLVAEAERLQTTRGFQLDHIGYPGRTFASPEMYVQTISLTGEVADQVNLGGYILPISEKGLYACQDGKPWLEIATTESGGRLLIYSEPVWAGYGSVVGAIQVARSLADYDQNLHTLSNILTLGGGVVTLAAFGVGWVLSGTALRPINRITNTAQAIGAERDFGRRVSYDGPNDEIGQLATTFNSMLTELQGAYEQSEQALQTQRRFVADASHELRTPLTTILGNLALLRRTPPISVEDRAASLADMTDESERLIRLVNNLLTLARSDAGRVMRRESVFLSPIVEDACRQVRLLAPERRLDCHVEDSVAVIGDRDAMKQVLLILLDNALKYTPNDGPITVSAQVRDGRVAVSVRDVGPGIAPDALPHIFERFFRGDTARTGMSAGLGLAIAKALMEGQQGTIEVQSEVGKGSVFTVTLPQSQGEVATGP